MPRRDKAICLTGSADTPMRVKRAIPKSTRAPPTMVRAVTPGPEPVNARALAGAETTKDHAILVDPPSNRDDLLRRGGVGGWCRGRWRGCRRARGRGRGGRGWGRGRCDRSSRGRRAVVAGASGVVVGVEKPPLVGVGGVEDGSKASMVPLAVSQRRREMAARTHSRWSAGRPPCSTESHRVLGGPSVRH